MGSQPKQFPPPWGCLVVYLPFQPGDLPPPRRLLYPKGKIETKTTNERTKMMLFININPTYSEGVVVSPNDAGQLLSILGSAIPVKTHYDSEKKRYVYERRDKIDDGYNIDPRCLTQEEFNEVLGINKKDPEPQVPEDKDENIDEGGN